jgi:hypothetical protein
VGGGSNKAVRYVNLPGYQRSWIIAFPLSYVAILKSQSLEPDSRAHTSVPIMLTQTKMLTHPHVNVSSILSCTYCGLATTRGKSWLTDFPRKQDGIKVLHGCQRIYLKYHKPSRLQCHSYSGDCAMSWRLVVRDDWCISSVKMDTCQMQRGKLQQNSMCV